MKKYRMRGWELTAGIEKILIWIAIENPGGSWGS